VSRGPRTDGHGRVELTEGILVGLAEKIGCLPAATARGATPPSRLLGRRLDGPDPARERWISGWREPEAPAAFYTGWPESDGCATGGLGSPRGRIPVSDRGTFGDVSQSVSQFGFTGSATGQ